ncbi:MAG: glycerol kinase GlpK [Gemmatimonadaceae bacterium]
MRTVLAIDQGTTGTTCLVVADGGRLLARAYREITQHYPRPGWVEHDPVELIERTVEAAREAIAVCGVTPSAIGITNQRETVVLWERATGHPVAPAIVWQDRRTAERCLDLASASEEIAAATGLRPDPYFSATKLEWLLRDRDLAHRARRGELLAGTVDSWLIWHLTGGMVHATDVTNASRTMLFDIHARRWSEALCGRFGIPDALLPEVRSSTDGFGATQRELFGAAVPIGGVAGDQQAALFGQGCWQAGEAKNTYGTGAFLLLNTGNACPLPGDGLLTTLACDVRGRSVYAQEASIFIAGAAIQWLRDGLQIIATAAESAILAGGTGSTDGVYFVPAFVGLGAPHWEPNARGMIVGLTRGTTRAHLVRAALEAMAYSTADVVVAMRRRGVSTFSRLRADGGAAANDWLMQFQADTLGVRVERPLSIEATALGAAGLGGIGAGLWEDGQAVVQLRDATVFAPGVGQPAAAAGYEGWKRATRAALRWAEDVG